MSFFKHFGIIKSLKVDMLIVIYTVSSSVVYTSRTFLPVRIPRSNHEVLKLQFAFVGIFFRSPSDSKPWTKSFLSTIICSLPTPTAIAVCHLEGQNFPSPRHILQHSWIHLHIKFNSSETDVIKYSVWKFTKAILWLIRGLKLFWLQILLPTTSLKDQWREVRRHAP